MTARPALLAATPVAHSRGLVATLCRWLAPFALAFAQSAAGGLPQPVQVKITSQDRDAAGDAIVISALLFRPTRNVNGDGSPLVIALHGCGGMFATRAGRETQLSTRFAHWTEVLLDDGYAVLWPDSFNPRDFRTVCRIRYGERTVNAAMRRLDVLGALEFAAELPGIDRSRIALVGWSHGGSTALASVNAQDRRIADFRSRDGAPPWFRAVVAFYPGCARSLKAGGRWRPGAPLAIHIGELDDWTPAAPCIALGEAQRAAGAPLTIDVYAGSYHGFDAPAGRVIVRKDVPNGVKPGEGVTVGPNPAARALADARVRSFLRHHLADAVAAPAAGASGAPANTTPKEIP